MDNTYPILYGCQYMRTNDTDTPQGGSIDTNIVIGKTTIGELIKDKSANAVGGSDTHQYTKCCLKNTHSSSSMYNAKIWIINSITDPGTSEKIQVRVLDVSDASITSIFVIGKNASGIIQTETITIGGNTSWITGTKTWKSGTGGIIAVFALDSMTGSIRSLVNDNCEIRINGEVSLIGIIPKGCYSAIGCIAIGLVGVLNDSTTTTNRVTAPSGISFSKPRIQTEALSLGSGGNGIIPPTEYQSIWVDTTYFAGCPNIPEAEFYPYIFWTA